MSITAVLSVKLWYKSRWKCAVHQGL